MLHLRPHNRFEDLDGMYLVGGGTHPGSGLPVIFESARISSRLLLEDLGVQTNVPLLPAREEQSTTTAPEKPGIFTAAASMLGLKTKSTL
jgi:phytoene desaturase